MGTVTTSAIAIHRCARMYCKAVSSTPSARKTHTPTAKSSPARPHDTFESMQIHIHRSNKKSQKDMDECHADRQGI